MDINPCEINEGRRRDNCPFINRFQNERTQQSRLSQIILLSTAFISRALSSARSPLGSYLFQMNIFRSHNLIIICRKLYRGNERCLAHGPTSSLWGCTDRSAYLNAIYDNCIQNGRLNPHKIASIN